MTMSEVGSLLVPGSLARFHGNPPASLGEARVEGGLLPPCHCERSEAISLSPGGIATSPFGLLAMTLRETSFAEGSPS
jgi:hypothetical protein